MPRQSGPPIRPISQSARSDPRLKHKRGTVIDSRAIEKARAFPIEVVAREHGLTLKAKGHVERVGPCPRCGGTDRFSINIRKRVFNCRGCQQGGDVIALMQFLTGCNFREAVTSLAGEQTTTKTHVQEPGKSPLKSCAFSVPEAEQQPNDYEARQLEKAKWLRRRSQPATGTPVATYLRGRLNGITKPLPPTIRYLAPRKPSHHQKSRALHESSNNVQGAYRPAAVRPGNLPIKTRRR
jgi:CHC2 zinc finger